MPLGLPPVAVATVQRHPSHGCRARSVADFFALADGRRSTAVTATATGLQMTLLNLAWHRTKTSLTQLHATNRFITSHPYLVDSFFLPARRRMN
jgi:hypothetical protein